MDNILSLQDAVECAKQLKNFEGILMAVTLHPEWLTTIPENRKWAMIHHIVYSSNITHLDQLLALQNLNQNFRLLAESHDHQTTLDIAKVLNDGGKMYRHIERLVKLDEMLDYAKNCQWDKCYEIVEANPSYGNEKPPYRRYYLIHHIAFANEIKQFERFQDIENFAFIMNLRADRKKLNVIAREGKANDFAKYIETNYRSYFNNDDEDDRLYEASETAKNHTKNIYTLMEERNIVQEPEFSFGPTKNVVTRGELDHQMQAKLLKQQKEKKKADRMNVPVLNQPIDNILNLLACSLTKATVTDPG